MRLKVSAVLLGATAIGAASPAFAFDWNSSRSFWREVSTQQTRVADGLRSGTLSEAGAASIQRDHQRVLAMRNNGGDRESYSAMLARTSGKIYRMKTN